jgi:undecaprenyl-diphosphatase
VAGRAAAGHATHVALVFTASCWWYVLVALGALAALLGWRVPAWRDRAIFSILTTLVAWQTSDALKDFFGRARPPYWYLHQETSYGYSSGHAMFAVVVYGVWSYYCATGPLPPPARRVLASGLALWGGAVIWSRLALGAHYVTDLIGGVLLGVAMLALATIVAGGVRRVRSGRSAARAVAAGGNR